MKPIVIFGAGDIAELACFYFSHDSEREVEAFTVDRAFLASGQFCGRPVVPFEEITTHYPPAHFDLFVAVSYAKVNSLRAAKCAVARDFGYTLPTYFSSKATIWPGVEVGDNGFILEDNTIQPFVRIGNNVTLWSGNHIGHHSVIDDNAFITSHVVVSGGVRIGDSSFIGVNSTIRDHVTIGRSCVIGAGSLILSDAADRSVYTQSPAELSRVPSNRLRGI